MGVMSDLHSVGALDEVILFDDMEPISPDDPEEYAGAVAGIQRSLDDFAAGRYQAEILDEPEAALSPFDVEGVDTGVTREEILEAIHEGRNSDRW